jgi:hypothetical protein
MPIVYNQPIKDNIRWILKRIRKNCADKNNIKPARSHGHNFLLLPSASSPYEYLPLPIGRQVPAGRGHMRIGAVNKLR